MGFLRHPSVPGTLIIPAPALYQYISIHGMRETVTRHKLEGSLLMPHFSKLLLWLCTLFSHVVRLSPLGTAATVLPTVPAPDDR
jgi:hypothetical protein